MIVMFTSPHRLITSFAIFHCCINPSSAAVTTELVDHSRAVAHAWNDIATTESTAMGANLGLEVTPWTPEDIRTARTTYISPSKRQEGNETALEDIHISVQSPKSSAEALADGQIDLIASSILSDTPLVNMATSPSPANARRTDLQASPTSGSGVDNTASITFTSSQDTRATTVVRARDEGATYAIETGSPRTTAAFLDPMTAIAERTLTIFVPTPMTPSNVSVTVPLVIAGESFSSSTLSLALPPPAPSPSSSSQIVVSLLTTIQLTRTEIFQTAVVLSTVITEKPSPGSGAAGSFLNATATATAPTASSINPSHTNNIGGFPSQVSTSGSDMARTDTTIGSSSAATTGTLSASTSTTSGSSSDSTLSLSRVTAPVTTAPPAPTSDAGNGLYVRRGTIGGVKAASLIGQWMHVALAVAIYWISSLL